MKKIAVIAAMAEEYETIGKYFGECKKTDLYGDFCIKTYNKGDKEIYFIKSGVGEIHAAAATQYAIVKYGAEAVFNFGLAGGLTENEGIGGIYLVKGVAHYDFDTSAIDDVPRGRYLCYDDVVVSTDEGLRARVKEISPKIEEVICASGDRFVSEASFKKSLVEEFGAKVCEMESAGVLFTAKNASVPCLIMKAVSDNGNHAIEFSEFLKKSNDEYARVAALLVEKL